MEYASTVWDPSTEKNTKSVENVQRQAARFVKSAYRRRSSVTTMLESFNWVSLASRRTEAKLVMLYRITNNLVDVTTFALTAAQTRTRGKHTPLLTTIHPHRSLQTLLLSKHHQIMEQMHTTIVSKQSLDSFRRLLQSRPT